MIKNIYKSKKFSKRLKFLRGSQYWSKKKIKKYQLTELKKLYEHVRFKVPFYIKYFSKRKIKIRSLDDIKYFPIITKKYLQQNLDEFIVKNIDKKKLIHRTTGGSTASPLTVWSDKDFQIKDKANTIHYMENLKMNVFKDRSIRLYGDKIPKNLIKKNIFWVKKRNKVIMSSFHVNKKTLYFYLKKLQKFKPRYIHTRPSAIYPLAKLLNESGIKLNLNLTFIIVDGEYLTKGQRNLIERSFSTRIINIYGHTEGALVGHGCLDSNFLHFMPQNGIIELLDENNRALKKRKLKGQIIATGFNNYIFPLIRYKTGDIGVKSNLKCKCGRNYNLLKEVEGRIQDYVIDKESNKVPIAPAIFNYNDISWKGVEEFKIQQKEKGKIIVYLNLEEVLNKKKNYILLYFKKKISSLLGKNFKVEVKTSSKLKKTSIGKYRYLDQKIRINA